MNAGCRVSVVVVTWNVRDLVCACLETVYCEGRHVPLEVIVVDNASTDGTAAAVRERFPAARVVANTGNVGFPIANNQALRHATGDYVLYLNPDTEVAPGTLQACVAALDEDPAVGVVGCRVVLEDGTIQLECARRPYLFRHLLMELLYLHMLFPRSRVFGDHLMGWWDHEGERDVEAICGAFMMARRAAVERVGGLPEQIFMYHEDLAFCLNVRRAGWRIRYLGTHSVLHRWRASSRKSTAALALLEGQCKVQLIRDAQGAAMAALARVVFALRCATRLVIGGAASLVLGRFRIAKRYPRVFDWRTHALQLTWAVAPVLVADRMPRPHPAPHSSLPRASGAAAG